jgi:hypothetical protein
MSLSGTVEPSQTAKGQLKEFSLAFCKLPRNPNKKPDFIDLL